ncbi:translation initiation factor IF-2 [Spirillospora sp. CA-294931]|uniref:translation initiation factor IF-2 n=1 Tax=Spirillospora sp. CA-294931 TaxID=3240042 RepID=UPI003D8B1859
MFGRRRGAGQGWRTIEAEREVLAVVRTVTSASRLLDVLPVFDGDLRVQVSFTVSAGSAFGGGLPDFLHGMRVVPWRRAVRTRFDLALTASANGALHRLKAPVAVMPHGVGHNRLVEAATGHPDVASGLSRGQLLHRGRVVPSLLVLSHAEQLARLRRTCPDAARVAIVTGDPAFDTMTSSLPARDRYRRALGAGPGQRLLVFSSTWGPRSLFGRHPGLLARWVAQLPIDRYRAALILHPNVWARHGEPQIDLWLADALDAGLRLVPPERGWQAALVAADWVVGDHGSVTYYAAALRRPTALAAFGAEELAPDSPLAAFGAGRPLLDPRRPLLDQLGGLRPPADLPDALGNRGNGARDLRRALYALMKLDPPPVAPRQRSLPEPAGRYREVASVLVAGTARADRVELDRYPATLDGDDLDDPHLLVEEIEADRRLLESAAVFVRREPPADADAWAKDVLAAYPGADLAVASLGDERALIVHRDGPRLVGRGGDVALIAAAVRLRHAAGLPLDGTWTVSTGAEEVRINVTPPRWFSGQVSMIARRAAARRRYVAA